MSTFWQNLNVGYYDKLIKKGLDSNRGIQANWHNQTFSEVKKLINTGDNHLDYACGSGTFIGYYLAQDSVGVDISQKQINYAKRQYKKNSSFYTLEEFNTFRFDYQFDVITILGLFEFLSDLEILELLEKLRKILKENGKIIITLPSFNILFKFLLKVSSSFGNVDYSEQHNKRNNLDDLIEIFDNLNFSNIVIKKILNLGLFFSFVNLNYGTIVNNFLSRNI